MQALSVLLFILDVEIVIYSALIVKFFYGVKKDNLSNLRNWNLYYLYDFLFFLWLYKIIPIVLFSFSSSISIHEFQLMLAAFGSSLFFSMLFLFLYLEGKIFSSSNFSKLAILTMIISFLIFLIPPSGKTVFVVPNSSLSTYLQCILILSPMRNFKVWTFSCVLIIWVFLYLLGQLLKGGNFKKSYLTILVGYFAFMFSEYIAFIIEKPYYSAFFFIVSRICLMISLWKIHKLFGEKDAWECDSK